MKKKQNNNLAKKRHAKKLKRKGKQYTSKVDSRQMSVNHLIEGDSNTTFV